MSASEQFDKPAPETPRTDAALLDAKLKHVFPNASFVHADFARQLERESGVARSPANERWPSLEEAKRDFTFEQLWWRGTHMLCDSTPRSADAATFAVSQRVSEIEDAIAAGRMDAPQVFTQMRQLIGVQSASATRDEIIEECALLCEGFQIHYSQLGYAENERTAWTLAGQIREMKTGGKRAKADEA